MSNWQPIKTAPKNGTVIDVWCEGKRYTDVHWSFSTIDGKPVQNPVWDGWAQEGAIGQSYTPNYIPNKGEKATHWMPIPAPPVMKS